jgi:NADPH:quinone reductase-like Zn-dependent oxidoreductase
MQAIECPRYGSPDVLTIREVPDPRPADNEVLIRVHAAGLNAADWRIVRADPAFIRLSLGLRRPRITAPGADVAGVVIACGSKVTRVAPGHEVIANLFDCGFGGYAQLAVAPEDRVAAKPRTLTFAEAATLPLAGETALQALRDEARVEPGDDVLIYGASGGVGIFAVQIAKALGARVTAVCSAAKLDLARELGADEAVDYAAEDVTARGDNWDVIVGVNGYRPLKNYLACLRPGGRYVMIGGTGRQTLEGLVGEAWSKLRAGHVRVLRLAPSAERLEALVQLVDAGRVRTIVDATRPLADAASALRAVEAGRSRGKTVLVVNSGPVSI